MSLQIKQSTTLSGTSMINGQQVATFNTSVSADQIFQNVGMTVSNQALYDDNKAEVRKDRDEFQGKADKIADSLDAENSSTSSSAASASSAAE